MAAGDIAGAPPTLRLLEPRALAGADRISSRILGAPLVQSTARGPLDFSERMLRSWGVGPYAERPVSAVAGRMPATPFPRPWFELPTRPVARTRQRTMPLVAAPAGKATAPSEEQRAIELVEQAGAPWAGAELPARRVAPPEPPITQRLVAQLARAEQMLGLAQRAATAPIAATGSSAVDAPLAPQVARGTEALSARAFVSSPLPRAAVTLSARAFVSSPLPRAAVAQGPAIAPRGAIVRSVAVVPANAVDPSVAVDPWTSPIVAPRDAAQRVSPALPPLALRTELPQTTPVAWPRLDRFIEQLAGPQLLEQSGARHVDAPTSRAVERAAQLAVLELGAPEPLRGVASAGVARPLVTATDAPLRTRRAPALATPPAVAPPAVAPPSAAAPSAAPPLGSFPEDAAPSVAPSFTQTSRIGAVPATLAGELAQHVFAGSLAAPGRLAQRAELLATLAEQRADRQLGFEAPLRRRQVSWSADAFTVVSLDPAPRAATSLATVLSAQRVATPLRTQTIDPVTRTFLPSPVPSARVDEPRTTPSSAPRAGFDAAYVAAPLTPSVAATPRADTGLSAPRARSLVAPASIAAVLAFADAQLGARMLEAARPLPVFAPSAVYVSPDAPAIGPTQAATRTQAGTSGRGASSLEAQPAFLEATRGTAQATRGATQAPRGTIAQAERAPASRPAFDMSGDFALVAPMVAPRAAASTRSAPADVGQLGRRSEQLAGELGVRVGSLASEFLIDVRTDGPPGAEPPTMHAREAGQGWLSTSEWILLSLFPSTSVAHEIAATVRNELPRSTVERTSRFPLAALPTEAPVVRPMPVAAPVGDAPTPAFLPDGRRPRGNRMVARAAMPTVGGAPPSLVATSEAAERRIESPVGAPLWGHLRPLVAGTQAPRPVASSLATSLSAAAAPGGARSTAMELVAPFIEASRAETTSGNASFNRAPSPVVSARAPDAPTKSLVTALSQGSTQPSNDRLSMADLTLISIVSASEQVAAASEGPAPSPAAADGRASTDAGKGGASSQGSLDEDHEVQVVAERAFDRLMDELRRYQDMKGNTWET